MTAMDRVEGRKVKSLSLRETAPIDRDGRRTHYKAGIWASRRKAQKLIPFKRYRALFMDA